MTPKIERFCIEYFKTFNPLQSLTAAGYSVKTRSGIYSGLSRLLSRPDVQDYLGKLLHRTKNNAVVTVQSILNHLQEMAFFDIKSILTDDGDIKPLDQWPEIASKIVAGYEVEVTKHIYEDRENRVVQVQVKRVKIPDRVRNTENLGRYLQMFTDNINMNQQQEVKVFFIPKFDDPANTHTPAGIPAAATAPVEHIKLLPSSNSSES